MSTVFWLLACLGGTWIITRSVIMAPLRRFFPKPRGTTPFFGTLVRCPQCAGFWVGAAMALVHPVYVSTSVLELVGNVVASACASSASGHLMQVVLARLGEEPPDDDDDTPTPLRLA